VIILKRIALVILVLALIATPIFITPTFATASWGVEVDTEYEYELKTFNLLGTDYGKFLKAQFGIYISFTDLNDTGYAYDVYNSTDDTLLSSNSTVFESMDTTEGPVIVPEGLPIALPLTYDTNNYLEYLGQMVNTSMTLIGDFGDILNITEIGEEGDIAIYSTLNSDYLKMYLDFYTPEVNATTLGTLLGAVGDTGFPIPIPTNLTDFTLNASISFNATLGLINDIILKIRSTSIDPLSEIETPFDVDFKWARKVPPPPPPPTDTRTTDTPYSWAFALFAPLLLGGILVHAKRKRKT